MNNKIVETLELRLTDAQIAAIRLRHQRRKRNVGGRGELDLGDISSGNGSDSSNACSVASTRKAADTLRCENHVLAGGSGYA